MIDISQLKLQKSCRKNLEESKESSTQLQIYTEECLQLQPIRWSSW